MTSPFNNLFAGAISSTSPQGEEKRLKNKNELIKG